jgi:hypothetical protein
MSLNRKIKRAMRAEARQENWHHHPLFLTSDEGGAAICGFLSVVTAIGGVIAAAQGVFWPLALSIALGWISQASGRMYIYKSAELGRRQICRVHGKLVLSYPDFAGLARTPGPKRLRSELMRRCQEATLLYVELRRTGGNAIWSEEARELFSRRYDEAQRLAEAMKDWTYALPEDPRVAARRLAKIEAALSEERQRQIRREIAVKAIRAINEAEKGTSLEELIRDLENDTSALREGGKIIGN